MGMICLFQYLLISSEGAQVFLGFITLELIVIANVFLAANRNEQSALKFNFLDIFIDTSLEVNLI